MTRNRFVLLCAGVVVVAFAIGLAWGLSAGGSSAGTPSSAPSSSGASASPDDPGLPAELVTGCRSQPAPVGTGWTCTTPRPGVDEVLVVRWPSSASMLADFATTYGSRPDGKCGSYRGAPASGMRSTWGNGKPLACYVNTEGAAVVLWEVPDRALELLAVRKDGDTRAAFTWWTRAITIPL